MAPMKPRMMITICCRGLGEFRSPRTLCFSVISSDSIAGAWTATATGPFSGAVEGVRFVWTAIGVWE